MPYSSLFSSTLRRLGLCSVVTMALWLGGCQEPAEPDAQAQAAAKATVEATDETSDAVKTPTKANIDQQPTIDSQPEDGAKDIAVSTLDEDIAAAKALAAESTPINNNATPNPEQTLKGAQITDVRYKSTAGDIMTVVFETSASGVLNAIIRLPNQPKITLSAPEGQGNNPTYRTTDGRIELVSHGGGSAIDLIQDKTVTSFDAISADAEVVTES